MGSIVPTGLQEHWTYSSSPLLASGDPVVDYAAWQKVELAQINTMSGQSY